MKAVVLAGGEGTRLRPLTFALPKQMLPVVGRPMLERVLEHLGAHGVDEVVLSLQYMPAVFRHAYPANRAAGMALRYATEPEPLDTAGAIRFAAEQIGIADTFVVANGDILTDLDLSGLVSFHRMKRAEATIHLHPVRDPSRFGVVVCDDEGAVTKFIEKPTGRPPSNLINAGTYVLEPTFLDRVRLGERTSIERTTFPQMATGGRLYAMADDAYWIDTGTPSAFLKASLDVLDGVRGDLISQRSEAPQGGQVVEPCFFGSGVTLAKGAIADRSVIGQGCVLARGALVRESVLMDEVTVGEGAQLTGSVVGSRATIGSGCRLEPGSVIGFGARLEPDRIVAGERVPA
ncbi:MAG: sugar phosphate nucleotidyltransferase [Acidimicrobiales bacterium]